METFTLKPRICPIWGGFQIVLVTTLFFILSPCPYSLAQEAPPQGITWEGFVDIYYAYDFAKPADHVRQPFLYNHNRHNEFNLNLGMVRGRLERERIRAVLGLQTGTYAQDNYSAEEGMLKNVFEANVGISLNQKNNIWLDAGIFPSHLGFESALSVENHTLTRSLAAENSPYFLSGAKLTFDPTDRLTLVLLLTNGWQRIARPVGNQTMGFGTQVNYHPSDNFSFNWSTFVGNDYPDMIARMRYFNNFYITWSSSADFDLIAGFDIGVQERGAGATGNDVWMVPTLIARKALTDKWQVAGRVEYFKDGAGVIIDYGAPASFNTSGYSLNLDYDVIENAKVRFEIRHLQSKDPIFRDGYNNGNPVFTNSNTLLLTSLAVKF